MSLRTDPDFFTLLAGSYARLLGKPLAPGGLSPAEGATWLYEEAPFGLLAHDTAPDPLFVYGNKRAQAIFEYEWPELIGLPSRLSAETIEHSERQAALDRVTRDGFVTDYRSVRVAKSGKRFWIEETTVWQLVDPSGNHRGQAAMIPAVKPIVDGI